MIAQRLPSLLLCSALAACASTDVGNPITAEIQFAGYETDAPQADALVLDSGLTINSAVIKVRSFKLDRSANCDDMSTDFEGTVLVDLLSQTMSASALWDGESDTYCRLRLQFTTEEIGSATSGWSVMVTGTTSNDEAFTATVDAEDTLSLSGPFTLPEGSHLLQVGFFLNEWFVADGQDIFGDNLVLDSSHPRYEILRANIATSARLFHDSDQNGVLDTEEIARSLAVGGN